jgi:hypothetical protein
MKLTNQSPHALSVGAVALLGLLAPAFGAQGEQSTARACVEIRRDSDRLACFDRVFPLDVSAGDQRALAPMQPLPAAPAARADLGREQLKSARESTADGSPQPTTLTANITALKEYRPGLFRVTLDNGQVWQLMDLESYFPLAAGESVRIDKGTMGGYQLTKVAPGWKRWTRVTRAK